MYRYKVKHNPFRRLKMAFKSRKRTRGNIFLGVVTTILASLSFTAMSACAKALAPISSEEMTFFRGLSFFTSRFTDDSHHVRRAVSCQFRPLRRGIP